MRRAAQCKALACESELQMWLGMGVMASGTCEACGAVHLSGLLVSECRSGQGRPALPRWRWWHQSWLWPAGARQGPSCSIEWCASVTPLEWRRTPTPRCQGTSWSRAGQSCPHCSLLVCLLRQYVCHDEHCRLPMKVAMAPVRYV